MLTWCLLLLFLDLNPQRTHGSDLKINNLLIKYLTAIYSFNSWESDALRTALGTRNAHDSTRWAAATKRVHSSFPSCKAENRRISLQSSIKHKMGRRKVMFKCIYGNHYPHVIKYLCRSNTVPLLYLLDVSFFWLLGVVAQFTLTSWK